MEWIKNVGSEFCIHTQSDSDTERAGTNFAVQPVVAVDMQRLPAQNNVPFDPRLQHQRGRPRLPIEHVADPCSHRESSRVEHEVCIRAENVEKDCSPYPLFPGLALTDVEMPGAGIAQAEVGFRAGPQVDQLPVAAERILRIETYEKCPFATVEYRKGAKHCFMAQAGPFAQQIGFALDDEDRPGKDDDQHQAARQRKPVVVDRTDRDTRTQCQGAEPVPPFRQVGRADSAAMKPAVLSVDRVPLLVFVSIRLHLLSKETRDSIKTEAGGEQRDSS